MNSPIYWIRGATKGRLGVMPRPRGGDWLEDEVRAWQASDVNVVVSLLTSDEVADMDLVAEEKLCRAAGIEFIPFPVADRAVPTSKKQTLTLAANLAQRLADGESIAIHCRQGIGRAPLLAITILLATGLDLDTAVKNVSAARGVPVPETIEQQRWLAELARESLVSTTK